jgi:hypothetical protein
MESEIVAKKDMGKTTTEWWVKKMKLLLKSKTMQMCTCCHVEQ